MTRFSIILPTYNRRDTIMRAVRSIQAQTFDDWELLITDDGSTDGTRDVLPTDDPRIRVFTQQNGGIASARNRGLRERRGQLVAFLDSDDEWLPVHLELADAFFRAHPGERLYMGEFVQNWGNGFELRHYQVELAEWFPALGLTVGSPRFVAPAPENDPYLRAYSSRTPIGEWGRHIAARAGYPDARHYRGHIFPYWRWGWMMLAQSTVVCTEEVDSIGLLDESYRICSDLVWMAELCRRNTLNLVTVPVVTKYEFGVDGRPLAEEHLAWGGGGVRFFRDMLRAFDALFWEREEHTPELRGIRAHWALQLAKAAVQIGDRDEALRALGMVDQNRGRREAIMLRTLVNAIPHPGLARAMYLSWSYAAAAPARLRARFSRRVP